ncbi:hypothetical protein OEZ86_009244 [Tetradesmus obliquus]|nr:hypothetical protein OEZ86_009244 [Tetradesmus obliquus]
MSWNGRYNQSPKLHRSRFLRKLEGAFQAPSGCSSAQEERYSFNCVNALVYKDQVVTCPGLEFQKAYNVMLVDEQDDSLVLAQKAGVRTTDQVVKEEILQVKLGMVQVEASFGSLAWAGMYYPKPRNENSPVAIHAQIVGAQVVVFTRSQPNSIWDMQWTGDDGTASFFLLPNSNEFIANMSVGDTLLSSSVIRFNADPSQPSSSPLAQQMQQQQLTAAPELLCTGEVEEVRGESGQFPANLTVQQGRDQPTVYHPRGFFCRWELLPDFSDLTVTVDYSKLLDDESITLYLAPDNVIQLRQPKQPEIGGVFTTTVWVERSIFIEFQTTRKSTSEVGAFSITWSSSSPRSRSLMDNRTMVVVLACVSAAGAVLAAFCFYCMCCSRRRRGAVVVDTSVVQRVSLLRVPSSVRELLPSKPYQPPPPDNPLPGAATEPDCCSICLVELEAGEHVTVLPCMHFYHKECIDSLWAAAQKKHHTGGQIWRG